MALQALLLLQSPLRRLHALHVLGEAREKVQQLALRVPWFFLDLFFLLQGACPFATGICPALLTTFSRSNFFAIWAHNLLDFIGVEDALKVEVIFV